MRTTLIDRTAGDPEGTIAKLPRNLQTEVRKLWQRQSRIRRGHGWRTVPSVELIEIRPRPSLGYICLNVWATQGIEIDALLGSILVIIRKLGSKKRISLERIDRHQTDRAAEILGVQPARTSSRPRRRPDQRR